MKTRREFLARAPLGLAGAMIACTRAPIIQLVDPEYTVLVKLDRSRIPG